jgi:dCTP deaminase
VSVLAASEIKQAMRADLRSRLVITPLLDRKEQIQDASVDLRLGTEFLVPTRSDVSLIAPHNKHHARDVRKVFRSFHVALGDTFVLHPKQFVLIAQRLLCKRSPVAELCFAQAALA